MSAAPARARARRIHLVYLGALVFGLLDALVKGDHGGPRDTIGNLSTPWLLVAFVAGREAWPAVRPVLAGTIATAAALLGYYLVVSLTTDDHLPTLGAHLAHVLHRNLRWLVAGAISGPLFGVIGAWERWTQSSTEVVGLLLMAEPLVIGLAHLTPGLHHVLVWTLDPHVYLTEFAVGAAVFLSARTRHKPSRP